MPDLLDALLVAMVIAALPLLGCVLCACVAAAPADPLGRLEDDVAQEEWLRGREGVRG